MIEDFITAHLMKRSQDLEMMCRLALTKRCGVRVDTYNYIQYRMRLDLDNTVLEIKEYMHNHEMFDSPHPECVNCLNR